MSNEDWGRVEFSLAPGLVPRDDPEHYVVEITGTVWAESNCLTNDGREQAETEAGRMKLLLVLGTQACNDQVALWEVCDAHSAMLANVYETLFQANEEPREEFDIEPSYSDLLYIESLEMDASFEHLAVRALETAISVFCAGGLIVATRQSLELSVEQWRELGFVKAAGSQFVFRDNCRINPYARPAE